MALHPIDIPLTNRSQWHSRWRLYCSFICLIFIFDDTWPSLTMQVELPWHLSLYHRNKPCRHQCTNLVTLPVCLFPPCWFQGLFCDVFGTWGVFSIAYTRSICTRCIMPYQSLMHWGDSPILSQLLLTTFEALWPVYTGISASGFQQIRHLGQDPYLLACFEVLPWLRMFKLCSMLLKNPIHPSNNSLFLI